ncbi:single-stranded DNA-binding protein [Candidatus Dojkabacteria bacterium]|nr:single-stranded DNA-binding protein [Candidatus Dojkabacteria bacterium]
MFGDINDARIMGNLTRDPELRTISTGTSVCNFSIATNRRYQQNDEWKEEVEFHNVVLWGQRAESFVQRAKKGTRVYIEGRLQTRSWEDQNGSKQYRTEVVANRIILIDRYEKTEGYVEEGSPSGGPPKPSDQKTSSKKSKSKASSSNNNDEEKIDPDDLPF